ncbi:MAG: GNAT family N-acetyltransferase [Hyphomicrobiaceae bacterium]|nr:GNAT family N-acetyltransferase [Hyphomicrobiaceae bacterium]
MVFLLGSIATEDYTVRAPSLALRPFAMSDFQAWADLRGSSRGELMPFEPKWAEHELTRNTFRTRIKIQQREAAEDSGYAFGIFLMPGHLLAGGISLSGVRRGVTQSAELGYWMGTRHTGKGLMTEAVGAMTRHAFGNLGLHRVEAATLPGNTASIRVLERNGFQREGIARSYLEIDGVWRDHIRFGLIETDNIVAKTDFSASIGIRG